MIIWKPFTVTQGGADTAAETSIATNIQPGLTLQGWELTGIEFTLKPDLVKAYAAADADVTLQVTKRSLAGSIARLVTYTDTDLIASFNLAMIASGTAANLLAIATTFLVNLPSNVIVYSENMYLQLITTGTGQTNVAWGRILYKPVQLSRDEAFAIVASRP